MILNLVLSFSKAGILTIKLLHIYRARSIYIFNWTQ
jgi:hypothetical protein